MHELALSEAIVDAALASTGGRRVRRIRVRVGGAHAADADALRFGFEVAALGTPAQDAEVEILDEPQRIRCQSCGKETVQEDGMFVPACTACGGVDVDVTGMAGVVVEQVTVEA